MQAEPPRWSAGKLAVQIVGGVAGVGLLGWAVSIAFSPSNRPGLDAIASAGFGPVAALVGLSILSLGLNGLSFWVGVRPIRRLALLPMLSVNVVATLLAILPFKLGMVVRVLIHRRRDGLAWLDLLAWFAACSAVAAGVILPVAAAGLWRGGIDGWWAAAALGGPILVGFAAVRCGQLADRWRPLAVISGGSHRIVRHPGIVASLIAIRLADLAVAAARFWVAARVAGVDLDPAAAALLGTTYFLIGVIAPAGSLGFAEMGTTGVAAAAGLDAGSITLVALVVTAAQTATAFALALPAGAHLRIWRLWRSTPASPSPASRPVAPRPPQNPAA